MLGATNVGAEELGVNVGVFCFRTEITITGEEKTSRTDGTASKRNDIRVEEMGETVEEIAVQACPVAACVVDNSELTHCVQDMLVTML
jgi:hypothetical protein